MQTGSFISGVLLFLLVLSGEFSTERLGLFEFEVRYLLFPLASIWVLPFSIGRRLDKRGLVVVIIAILFLFGLLLSAISNISGTIVEDKIIDIASINLMVLLLYVAFSKDHYSLLWFVVFLALAGLAYSVIVVLSAQSAGRGSIGVGGPNVVTRVIFLGMLSLILLGYLFRAYWLFLLVSVYIAGLVSVGSRGGIVGAVVAIAVVTIFQAGKLLITSGVTMSAMRRWGRAWVPLLISILVFIGVIYPWVEHVFQRRFVLLLIDRVHTAGRADIYLKSIDAIRDNPLLGLGLGGYTDLGIANYPHNLVLELLLDGGLLMVPVLISFLVLATRIVAKASHAAIIPAIGVVYMLLVQQVSGGYYDFRYFFVFALLALYVDRCREKPRG